MSRGTKERSHASGGEHIAVSVKVLGKVILGRLELADVLGAERMLEKVVGDRVRESQEIKQGCTGCCHDWKSF